jgi:nucleoside-triphosphatase THEP1
MGPVLRQVLHLWLKKKQTRSQEDVKQVFQLLPATQKMMNLSWKQSGNLKGLKRLKVFAKNVLVNTFHSTESSVYILTRPIQTGKTTSLIEWSSTRNDVRGIFTPIETGKRVFMNAETKEKFRMEAEDNEESLHVGKYRFSKKNFGRAEQIIRDAITKEGWLVIDEIGPLELNGKGFSMVLTEVLQKRNDKLLLVVREVLVEKVKEHFQIKDPVVVNEIKLLG